MEGVKPIGEKWGEGERKSPSPEDVERVLGVGFARAQDRDKMRAIISLLATTGLRISEALTLRLDDVDLDARELKVFGKGRKRRVVPLLEPTRDMLVWWTETRPNASPFLFPGKTREGHAHVSNVEKTLKRACLRAGVEPFTPHQLRHFYATEMLRGGAKLEVVSRLLGHAGVGITGDIYRHVSTGEMHEAVDRFAPLNGNGGQAGKR